MLIETRGFAIPGQSQLGNVGDGAPGGIINELLVSQALGRYSTLAKSGRIFSAHAILTAPVIWSTAAGTGGPLLWNRPNSARDLHILAAAIATPVVTTVAGAIGITGNGGQTAAPGSTTAIDSTGNLLIGGGNSTAQAYRLGTPTNAGGFFQPIFEVHTGALTVNNTGLFWADLGGIIVVPPGSWVSLAGSATLTTLQVAASLIWAELPA